jgi:hypothetical protein
MKQQKEPISIETAFGRPDALDRAAAKVAQLPICTKTRLKNEHCPWFNKGGCSVPPDLAHYLPDECRY